VRTYPVLVAELDPEGVLDGLGGRAVAAAGVAHEDEDVLGAAGPELDELDGALLLLPEGLVVGPVERGGQGGGELPGVGEALAQLPPHPLLLVVRRHGLQHRLPDRPPPRRRHGRRHRGEGGRTRARSTGGGGLGRGEAGRRRRRGERMGCLKPGMDRRRERRVRAVAWEKDNWNDWRLRPGGGVFLCAVGLMR
jgi:hypothetical protein